LGVDSHAHARSASREGVHAAGNRRGFAANSRRRPEGQKELEEAQRHDELSAQEHAGAEEANAASDTYVLLTVAFAWVLFFGGIGGSLQSRRLRISFFVIALVLFTVTMITLETMPICKQ
jgi:hypothetical protein